MHYLNLGYAAILKVSNEPHYVLGYAYSGGSSYFVDDPRQQKSEYWTNEVFEAIIYSRADWCNKE